MIEMEALSKTYSNGVIALRNINLAVHYGEFVSIIGQSGSGKSTLMNIIGCLDRQTDGYYRLNDMDVRSLTTSQRAKLRNRMIGFIFQGYNLSPKLTAYENVELPLLFRGETASERRALIYNALERVGLTDRIQHYPHQLSGGQQQRVAIARAIASRPPIILADEPTGSLDRVAATTCMDLLQDLHREGHTLILITHDSGYANYANRILYLDNGFLQKA